MYTLKASLTSPHNLSAKFEDLYVKNPHDGATFYPFVSEDGVISWTNDKELENPSPVNIKGEKGNNGYTPVKGVDYWTVEDKKSIVNETINSNEIQDVAEAAERAEAIARGKATGYVFDTLEDMQLWLADKANKNLLNLGDNLYIRALNVPDYWWDGNAVQQLETQKVDLDGYMKAADYPTEKWTFTLEDGTTVEKDVVIK